ncbi:MAG: hypothetical protein DMF40_03920 [Verrucomicrobia bacterium]|nr:MAG: hypothetical protein DMF40_03920 [Verrucomicrobiota bacterium]
MNTHRATSIDHFETSILIERCNGKLAAARKIGIETAWLLTRHISGKGDCWFYFRYEQYEYLQ